MPLVPAARIAASGFRASLAWRGAFEGMPMRAPIILLAADAEAAADLERDVGLRYGGSYRIVSTERASEGVDRCAQARADGDRIAVALVAEQLPDGAGDGLLSQVHRACPEAGRILLTRQVEMDPVVAVAGDVTLDRCLVVPWGAPEGSLYPVLDELLADWRARAALPDTRVADVMDTDYAWLHDGADLMEAAELVARTRVSDLMVLDDDGRFVGVLSEGDILRGALPDLDQIVAAGGTLADGYQLFLARARELSATSITQLVIEQPLVAHPDDHVAKIATLLVDRQIRRLPVVREGQLRGTVSRADICRAVVEAR